MTMASAEYLTLARAIDCTNYHFDRCITVTRAGWQEELHCTPKQIRLVLEKMTALDLIVREQHFFANKASLFVRPTETLFLALTNDERLRVGQFCPDQDGRSCPDQGGPLGPSLYVNLHSKL